MTEAGRSANKGGGQPVTSQIPLTAKTRCDFSLRYSKGNDRQVDWVKETDEIMFTNFIHNFDLNYLVVISNYIDFKICVARDEKKVFIRQQH